MVLWLRWFIIIKEFRPVFSRKKTFLWFVVVMIGFSIRRDLMGVTSFIRALGIKQECYDRILGFFNSNAITPDRLAKKWVEIVLKFVPGISRVNGRILFVADGIKISKSGSKMPCVKKLHQESDSNTKPEYISGHSCQAVSILLEAGKSFFALPLISRICEGVVYTNRDKRTLLDKIILVLNILEINVPFYFIADAYYASAKIVLGLPDYADLITRARLNSVAYYEPVVPLKKKKGRPKKYGKKVKLKSLFKKTKNMKKAMSPIYGDKDVEIQYLEVELLWRPVGKKVKFVIVIHPTRGKIILMTTDLKLDALKVIKLYSLRFKIEVSFKQSIHTVGTYLYHFWMKDMKPRKKNDGNKYLHRETKKYREKVERKIRSYHLHIQIGIIAQGLLQYLSVAFTEQVWENFGSWIKTIRPGVCPSEFVTSYALYNTLPKFLCDDIENTNLTKLIRENIDIKQKNFSLLVS